MQRKARDQVPGAARRAAPDATTLLTVLEIGQLKRKVYDDTHIALVQQQYSRMVNVKKYFSLYDDNI